MAKKIKKIVWDTERGVGVVKEYTPSLPLEGGDAVARAPRSVVAASGVTPEMVRRPHDPFFSSRHVLDLRHVHAGSRVSFSDISFWSRLLSRIQQWKIMRARKKSVVQHTPLFRFPSIQAGDFITHTVPSRAPTLLHQDFFAPSSVLRRFPLLAKLSIGVVMMPFVYCLWIFFPLLARIAFFTARIAHLLMSPRRFFLWMTSGIRYVFRRLHIEIAHRFTASSTTDASSRDVSTALPRASFLSPARALIVFVLIALILTAPFQAFSSYATTTFALPDIEVQGKELIAYMDRARSAMENGEWAQARDAWEHVRDGSTALGDRTYLTHPVFGPLAALLSVRARTGRALVATVSAIGDIGIALSDGAMALYADALPTDRLARIQPILRDLEDAFTRAQTHAAIINATALPVALREHYGALAPFLEDGAATVRRVRGLIGVLPQLLGADRPMRYLAVFQNDAEARATGGFIGSIGVIDFDHGAVRKIFMPAGGSYDLQGSLRVNFRAPEPLQYVNPRFEFQDANWWPDFPTSAKKLLFLWEKSGGPTVDGVIAINASLFEKLLTILGPVDLPAYGKRIDAQNFFIETQKAVELEYDRVANTPKKFLRDLAEAVIARMGTLDRTLLLSLTLALFDAVPEKLLQVYLVDPALQEAVAHERMSGAFTPLGASDDALRIVRTNIGGGKTDRVVRDAVTHEAAIRADGEVIDRVVITRVHQGKRGELFTGTRSRDYLRVYVPRGAILVTAEGFSLPTRHREMPPDEYADDPDLAYLAGGTTDVGSRVTTVAEGNRTFFGGWVELDPGEVKTLTLTYRLPFRLSGEPYRAHFERQSGMPVTTIMHRTLLPSSVTKTHDTIPSLTSPQPWQYDMTLLQTFSR